MLIGTLYILVYKETAINQKNFKQHIVAMDDISSVILNDITPFEWDSLYTFTPYVSKEMIEGVIGFRSSNIKETVSEGMVQLLFIKNDKIVCSICGYADYLGYEFNFGDFQGSYFMLNSSENPVFKVDKSKDIISFTLIKYVISIVN